MSCTPDMRVRNAPFSLLNYGPSYELGGHRPICTADAWLFRPPLYLLSYVSTRFGGLGRHRTRAFDVRSVALYPLSYEPSFLGGPRAICTPGLHLRRVMSYLLDDRSSNL